MEAILEASVVTWLVTRRTSQATKATLSQRTRSGEFWRSADVPRVLPAHATVVTGIVGVPTIMDGIVWIAKTLSRIETHCLQKGSATARTVRQVVSQPTVYNEDGDATGVTGARPLT